MSGNISNSVRFPTIIQGIKYDMEKSRLRSYMGFRSILYGLRRILQEIISHCIPRPRQSHSKLLPGEVVISMDTIMMPRHSTSFYVVIDPSQSPYTPIMLSPNPSSKLFAV